MGRGRPRKSDPDVVLDIAMKSFWERGFEGTSMNDIAAATGMAKPGLYATFGDKEALYAKALNHYGQEFGTPMLDDLARSSDPLDTVLRRFLGQVADAALDKSCPQGCFVVNTLVECADLPGSLQNLGREFDRKRNAAFTARFRSAKKNGEIPEESDVNALSDFFSGQALALGVMARAGSSRASLNRLIDVAMTTLPAADDENRS